MKTTHTRIDVNTLEELKALAEFKDEKPKDMIKLLIDFWVQNELPVIQTKEESENGRCKVD